MTIRSLLVIVSVFGASLVSVFAEDTATKPGVLIAGYGVSGSGKSTTFRELHKLLDGSILMEEPEANLWPEEFQDARYTDTFSFLMSLRCLRLPQLLKADQLRQEGRTVLLEPYYMKLHAYYLNQPEMHWLVGPENPYYETNLLISQLDADTLPDADVLVIFDIDFDTWHHFITTRNREEDNRADLDRKHGQQKFNDLIEEKLSAKGVKVIRFQQTFSSPQVQALALKQRLHDEGII